MTDTHGGGSVQAPTATRTKTHIGLTTNLIVSVAMLAALGGFVAAVAPLGNGEVQPAPKPTPVPTVQLRITSPSQLPSAIQGRPYSFMFKAVGGTAPYIWGYLNGGAGVPYGSGLTEQGKFDGIYSQSGVYQFAIQVTDAHQVSVSKVISINVKSNTALRITSVNSLPTAAVGSSPYAFKFKATGGSPYGASSGQLSYRWKIIGGSVPSGWLTFNDSYGTMIYSSSGPQSTDVGFYSFVMQVTDSAGATDTEQFYLTVGPRGTLTTANNLLANGEQLPDATNNFPYSFDLTAVGGTPPYTWSPMYQGAGFLNVLLSSNGNLTGVSAAPGLYDFAVQVSDALGNTTQRDYKLQVNPSRTLQVSVSDHGVVTSSNNPIQITCGSTGPECSHVFFPNGSSMNLTATSYPGYVFAGWNVDGIMSTANPLLLYMYSDHTITATFEQPKLSITKFGSGSGTVVSSGVPSSINCGSVCSYNYVQGTSVMLITTSAKGSKFTGWSGACSGTSTCTVTMDNSKSVVANFTTVVSPLPVQY